MKQGKLIDPLRRILLTAMLAPWLSQAVAGQVCDDKVVASLKASWQIGTEGSVRAASCKLWPDDSSKMFVALAYEPPNYPAVTDHQLPLYLAIVNLESLNVLGSYKGSIEEDAVTLVNEGSLAFDTARYFLAKNVRAFGLRVSATVQPRFSEGGYGDVLSLYVIEGEQIRPVLHDLPMRYWTYEGGFYGGGTNYTTKKTDFSLSVAPTTSHGFFDLLVTAKTTGLRKTTTQKLQYDGQVYPFDMIDLQIKLSGSK